MSDYQYLEFQAVDLPLGEADREQLRALSPTARITASSFADDYQWENFKGNPRSLMARWFDLHVHLSSWGTRRLMIRLPQRLVDRSRLDRFLHGVQIVDVWTARDNLVVDVRDDGRKEALCISRIALPSSRPWHRCGWILPPEIGGRSTCCG